jgi:uncharacterized protein (DUF1501 family)
MLLPVTMSGFDFKFLPKRSSLVQSALKTNLLENDKVLVLIYLNGGNDGLNTVIPIEYYSQYYNLRSNIAIPENKVLKLDANPQTGLHPSMSGMQEMYNKGELAIIHSVSYPNPNQSHYRSTDIWMTGVDSDEYSESGWAGRYLDGAYPGYPANYPNEEMEDPLAIQIGYINTTTLLGKEQPMNVSLQNPNSFYQLLGSVDAISAEDLPCCDGGELIKYFRQQQVLSSGYSQEIKRAGDAGTNMTTYPSGVGVNDLGEQLKIVARLIHGGLRSKIYCVELRGFDTHASQVSTTSTTEGEHASLLKQLSEAITAFQKDLRLQGTIGKVIGLTFSDFGRRANSSASKGTDHGIAAPMFVFGTGIKRQLVGTNPDLINDMIPLSPQYLNQDIKMQIDFRRIYSDILRDWFGTPEEKINAVLFKGFPSTSLFSETVQSTGSGFWADRSIWSSGRPPGAKDYVQINSGHIVSLGQNISVRNIKIEGGGELKVLGDYQIGTTG